LDIEYEDPFMNMAVEEAVARRVGEGTVASTVRFWRNSNAVVIGSHQDARAEVNSELCSRYGIALVRRFTGGGAVYHDLGNLNFAISLPESHRIVKNDILDTFQTLSLGIINGLRSLGLEDATSECGNSICINGRKLSGLAGCIKWGVVFCHGSILVASNIRRLAEVLRSTGQDDKRAVRSMPRTVTTLSDEVCRAVSISEAKAALKRGLEKTFEISLIGGVLSAEERDLARRLLHSRYATDTWNQENLWEDMFATTSRC